MPIDRALIPLHVQKVFGEKPHPAVPEIKIKDYEAFARTAAKMFSNPQPPAKQVQTAYHALTNAGVSPGEFERVWDIAKPLANRLLDRDPSIHDIAMLATQHPGQIQQYYMDHPHPDYPEAKAGDIARYAAVARYPANKLAGRLPNMTELHKFVMGNYSIDDIVAHYSDDGSLPTKKQGQPQQQSPLHPLLQAGGQQ